jgi:hypothetical protein
MLLRRVLLVGTGVAALAAGAALPATAAALRVGSGNEAVIEPPVPHPHETPCSVPLVVDGQFASFNPVNFNFTPPAACPGPWAKVVLSMKLSLNAGRQFDRTGLLVLNGVPLWFGTTAEPRATLAPNWNFSRDVTSYTALFEAAQTGSLSIGNVVDSTYTSTITANATLEFYPVTKKFPAPVTADVVLPLASGGGAVSLGDGTQSISNTLVFPRNVLKAKLDVYLQGQGGDEFWYTCVPNALAGTLESCGGGALREGEVSVDSLAAGVAPVFPWVFTGGIDPYLWQPIPGVQTFDFTPYEVDLSPFAGVLSDGSPHTISASVFGDNNYFQATGAILLFLDHGATTVSGSVTYDNLQPVPNVATTNTISTANGVTTGNIDTVDNRNFTITGTVNGSAGTTTNSVTQKSVFGNLQIFTVSATQDEQKIRQHTNITSTSTSTTNGVATTTTQSLQWPFTLAYNFITNPGGNSKQITNVTQGYILGTTALQGGAQVSQDNLSNTIATADTLFFDSNFNVTGHKSQSENATYQRTGSDVSCFSRTLQATSNILSLVQTGC